jgi:GNAT superfamily N-acetyltransferase
MATTSDAPQKTISTSTEELIIRKARLWDGAELGRIAAATYMNTPLSGFVAPKRYQYPEDWERGFMQRAQKRLFEPRNLSFVVVTKSNPDLPVGYAQFIRFGDDEGARKQIESHSRLKRIMLKVLAIVFTAWHWIVNFWAGGDKSEDKKAVATFARWGREEWKTHWDSWPERKNRWHAQSVVIREEFQGRKAGKRLMAEIIGRAEAENVVVGLESSKMGELMYRSVGFEILARFSGGDELEERAGGVMMYTPKARR